jgi:hypothetical protein
MFESLQAYTFTVMYRTKSIKIKNGCSICTMSEDISVLNTLNIHTFHSFFISGNTYSCSTWATCGLGSSTRIIYLTKSQMKISHSSHLQAADTFHRLLRKRVTPQKNESKERQEARATKNEWWDKVKELIFFWKCLVCWP